MTTAEEAAACLAGAAPPRLAPGESRRDGVYLRNLKGKHVARRYEKDDDAAPRFGYKLKPRDWAWTDRDGQGGLSVNLQECIHTPRCSILIHPHAAAYVHVAAIDLPRLSGALRVGVLACYDPVEDPLNPCHFVLVPDEKSSDDLRQAFADFVTRDFPPARLPQSPPEIAQAEQARTAFEAVVRIDRHVVAWDAAP